MLPTVQGWFGFELRYLLNTELPIIRGRKQCEGPGTVKSGVQSTALAGNTFAAAASPAGLARLLALNSRVPGLDQGSHGAGLTAHTRSPGWTRHMLTSANVRSALEAVN